MKRRKLRFGRGFRIALGNRRLQSAEMVLGRGAVEGDPRGGDQWLYAVSGTGAATVDGTRYRLVRGTVVLVEHGGKHEIRNTGRTLLRMLDFYLPPAYTPAGDALPRARR